MSIGEEFIRTKKAFQRNPYGINPNTPAKSNIYKQKEFRKPIRKRKSKWSEQSRAVKGIIRTQRKSKDTLGDITKELLLIGAGIFLAISIMNKLASGGKFEGTNEQPSEDGSELSTGKMSEEGKKQLKADEGCYLYAYDDADKHAKHPPVKPGDPIKGTLTIGYGHTGPDVKPGMTITQEQADALFEADLAKHEAVVNKQIKDIKTPITQRQYDAMVNYAYNNGSLGKKFLGKLKSGDYLGAASELEVGGANVARMSRLQNAFRQDVTSENKLKTLQQLDSDLYNKQANTFNNYRVTSGFGKREAPTAGASIMHKGIDLAMAEGTPLHSFTSGTVIFSGWMEGYGKTLVIQDSRGYRHLYAHLSKILKGVNAKVKKGELVAYTGSSGIGTGAHLHYSILKPNKTPQQGDSISNYVDPRTYKYKKLKDDYNKGNKNTEVAKNTNKKSESKQTIKPQNTEINNKISNIRTLPTNKISAGEDIDYHYAATNGKEAKKQRNY